MFWDGIKKEHEMFAVFGSSTRNLKTKSFMSAPTPPGGPNMMFPKSGPLAKPSLKASTNGSEIGRELLTVAEREERIQELEEYVNIAHRSTVLLCQLLSFLAMAVFFYEENESLLSSERWIEIRSADTLNAFYLIAENVLEGIVQVLLTSPITLSLIALFKRLDQAGTAKVLFETR